MPKLDQRWFLQRRNALWHTLRQHAPGEAGASQLVFESALKQLETLTGWSRARILAGLGLSETELRWALPP